MSDKIFIIGAVAVGKPMVVSLKTYNKMSPLLEEVHHPVFLISIYHLWIAGLTNKKSGS